MVEIGLIRIVPLKLIQGVEGVYSKQLATRDSNQFRDNTHILRQLIIKI